MSRTTAVPPPGLTGIRVLDFTQVMAGPYCSRLLVEHGAEVIKVEPIEGDMTRHRPPIVNGRSRYFGQLNAGKRSLAVDLRSAEVRQAMHAIIANVDVVVENFRPGVLARHDLGASDCMKVNPRLVYCSISGYGQNSARAAWPAVAPVIHAASGLDAAMGLYSGAGQPLPSGVFTADVLAGALAFGAINAALLGASRTGEGTYLDVSLTDSVLSMLVHETQAAQHAVPLPAAAYEAVQTSDGHVMVAILTDRHFAALCTAIDAPGLASDQRFNTMAVRRFNTPAMREEIERWTIDKPAAEVEERLNLAGVPCGQYRTAEQWLNDDDLIARGVVREATDPSGGFKIFSGSPVRLDDQGCAAETAESVDIVSDLGAHSRATLRDLGGLSDDEVSALVAAGVVAERAGWSTG